jgi:hypothetical protein
MSLALAVLPELCYNKGLKHPLYTISISVRHLKVHTCAITVEESTSILGMICMVMPPMVDMSGRKGADVTVLHAGLKDIR